MNKFSTRCFLACLAACATASIAETARAVDATPDVEVGIPDVIYLKTFSKFVCNFPATSLIAPVPTAGVASGTATIDSTGTVAVGSISKDAVIDTTSPFTTLADQKCDALNAFAVWGTGGTAGEIKVDVAVNAGGGTLTESATSKTMTLSNVYVQKNGTTMATDITKTDSAPGLSTPYKGDIRLKLNITTATRSGNYTGGKIKISAVSQ
jgi:hypothetical protein